MKSELFDFAKGMNDVYLNAIEAGRIIGQTENKGLTPDIVRLIQVVKRQRAWNVSDLAVIESLLCEAIDKHIETSRMLSDMQKEGVK